jgi:ABC-2 type transport system permease protein
MRQWLSNIYRLGLKELRSLRADPVLLVLIAYVFSFAVLRSRRAPSGR